MLHSIECRKMLNQKIKRTKAEATKGTTLDYNRFVKACPIKEDTSIIEGMRAWTRKIRMFRANSVDSKQHDIRKIKVL